MITEFFDGPIWASPQAQRVWEPRLRLASRTWEALESVSVAAGVRSSSLQTILPEKLPARVRLAYEAGLSLTVLGSTLSPPEYTAGQALNGKPALRAALHRPGLEKEWFKAWDTNDDDLMGRLLGFPKCCREFFEGAWKTPWTEHGWRDTTPFMPTLDGPVRTNILLRWLGVRLVPHLPCSGDCKPSAAFADRIVAVGRAGGMDAGIDALEELLGLKMNWSACHGIMEVVTHIFRFRASTVYSAEHLAKQRNGTIPSIELETPSCEDNGFSSEEAMLSAHSTVLSAVRSSGFAGGTVLDLGCGDGALLHKLCAESKGIIGFGIDYDEQRVRRGRQRHPELQLKVEDIANFETPPDDDVPWDMILLMPGRLMEMERGKDLVKLLPKLTKRVVVYAYGDWLKRGSVNTLAFAAGLPELTTGIHVVPGVVEAAGIVLRG